MARFHTPSFLIGLCSGFLVLLLVVGGYRMIVPAPANGGFGQRGFSLSRMADRLGISQDELQKELNSGKTFQQIAAEHGVTLPAGGRFGGGSGQGPGSTASGASVSHPASSSGSAGSASS